METTERVSNPSDALYNLFGKPLDIDAVKLVEGSWEETPASNAKKLTHKTHKEATD
ncbi:MAG: hypothetical protein ABSE15_06285 [Candidatus Bathyarchaeia archaeon]|jgi:hypothetical protein